MTLPTTGQMTAAMINGEIGRVATAPFNINGIDERDLADKPSGAIAFSDFRGKTWIPPYIMNAASSGSGEYGFNFNVGYGSITPTTYNGNNIWGVFTSIVVDRLSLGVLLDVHPVSKDYFTAIEIDGVGIFPTASAYSFTSDFIAKASWYWDIGSHLTVGQYRLKIY